MTDLSHPNVITVIARAKEIVMLPKTQYGYSDIGDVLVSFLRGEKSSSEAIESMNNLNLTYERERARQTMIANMTRVPVSVIDKYELAARNQGWALLADGAFERSASDEPERVHFLGDWKALCEFADIKV